MVSCRHKCEGLPRPMLQVSHIVSWSVHGRMGFYVVQSRIEVYMI